MRSIFLYIVCLFLVVGAMAQKKGYKGMINVTPLKLEQVGDSLRIGINFDATGVVVKSRYSVSLIPMLIAPDNQQQLPEVMVKGQANYLTSKRELALMSKAKRRQYDENVPYAIIKGSQSKGQNLFDYRQVIAFEPWMKDARLDIRENLRGCGNNLRSLSMSPLFKSVLLERVIEPYDIVPHLAYAEPEAEVPKRREMMRESFLDFVVSKVDIRPDYMNNPVELKKITDMVEEVRRDNAITVGSISVIGYASPEGPFSFNQSLSEGRANALVNYLIPRFDYPRSMYSIEFGGENWSGLLAKVESSDMKYREQVLSILTDKTINDNTRKTQLKKLANGEPYRFMLKEYYPTLRKAICKIQYEVKGFDVTQAKAVFRTNPRNLSLNEMYLVAKTYETGSGEFMEIFATAVKLFPDDVTANLNAASTALAHKDIVVAEQHLNKIDGRMSTAEYYNTMGILMLLKGEYDKAEVMLKRAVDGGLEIARANLGELNQKRANIELLKKQRK